jgi:hypothetical protein
VSRQAIPGRAPVEWPTQRDAGFDALVECRGSRGIVAAQAHAPHAKAFGIEIGPLFDEIDNGLHRHFVVAANGEVILRFALARPFEDERCDTAGKERCFVGIAFFLGRIESDRHHHNRWPVDAHRLAQDAGEHLSLIRDLDTFAGRSQVRQCHLPAFDLLPVRAFICAWSWTKRKDAK